MTRCIVFIIFYIVGVHSANLSVDHHNDKNVTACDVEHIEDLDMEKLIDLAVKNESCRNEAMTTIHRDYNFTKVDIIPMGPGFKFENGTLHIAFAQVPAGFWKVFSHSIDSIVFNCYNFLYGINSEIVEGIASLRSVLIYDIPMCDFDQTKPFRTVEHLTIVGRYDEKSIDQSPPMARLDYGQIFPDVRTLRFERLNYVLDFKMRNLTVFEANFMKTSNFTRFFANNPQIKTLNVNGTSMEYLEAAHGLLPQLENFTFVVPKDFQSYNGPKFVFPNVKSLFIKDEFQTFDHTKFTFASLEQLTIDMGSVQLIENGWSRFIENHKHLKSIKTTERAYFHANGLLNLSKAANLVEADIFGGPCIEIEHIVTFVRNSEHLQRFKLNFLSFPSFDEYSKFVVRLRDELDEKWKLNQADRNFSGYKYIELINLKKNATNGQA